MIFEIIKKEIYNMTVQHDYAAVYEILRNHDYKQVHIISILQEIQEVYHYLPREVFPILSKESIFLTGPLMHRLILITAHPMVKTVVLKTAKEMSKSKPTGIAPEALTTSLLMTSLYLLPHVIIPVC